MSKTRAKIGEALEILTPEEKAAVARIEANPGYYVDEPMDTNNEIL